jgi:hypothetical protein
MAKLLRTLGGVLVGYVVMVALITLVQEAWLGGVTWRESSLGTLALAGIFTAVSGAIGAAVATALTPASGRSASLIMAVLIVVETTTLIVTGKLTDPLWFDALAALSLLAAVLLGGELWLRRMAAASRAAAPG